MKKLILLVLLVLLLAACAPPSPKLILARETVISEVPVTVEVTRVIEVTREVEVTRVIAILREIEVTRQVDAAQTEETVPATAVPDDTTTGEDGEETAVSAPTGSFNLMPMGDSIVAGWYWVPVFSDDHRDQCNFWLVGSAEGDNIYVPSREGHGSATTGDFLAEQWHTTATENYDPDVVLLMLGTNDYSDPDATAAGTAAQLKQIVDEIHAVNADVEIFVAIIPRTNKEMADYDAALQTMPDVTYVDQFSGFDPETMTDDGVHPNDIGSQLIADVYYAALQSAGYCP